MDVSRSDVPVEQRGADALAAADRDTIADQHRQIEALIRTVERLTSDEQTANALATVRWHRIQQLSSENEEMREACLMYRHDAESGCENPKDLEF